MAVSVKRQPQMRTVEYHLLSGYRHRGGFEDLPPLSFPQFAALSSPPPPNQPCRLTLVPRCVDATSAAMRRPR
ncbi:hypothetical protein J6590_011465 [Homalodisca vitripennis]|nr:hypothetical protein J6590_011465 [Homalodisca vitripennis]